MEAADSSETLINLYLTVEWCLRRQFPQVNSSHCKCVSLKIITLRFHCMMLQCELTAVKADRSRLERQAGNFVTWKCGGEAEGNNRVRNTSSGMTRRL